MLRGSVGVRGGRSREALPKGGAKGGGGVGKGEGVA